jgi:ASC-1-like (ASCH) protein
MKIEKKILPEYFNKIEAGEKTFEIRLADWQCKAGDVLVLREWDKEIENYTGRKIEKSIKHVGKTKAIDFYTKKDIDEYGFQIIGF